MATFLEELLPRVTICSLCILTNCNFSFFPFWFEGLIWVMIASVSDLCILFTFTYHIMFGGMRRHFTIKSAFLI